MKICDVCRAPNELEAAFCGTCGSPLPATPAPAADAGPPARTESAAVEPEPGPGGPAAADDGTVVPKAGPAGAGQRSKAAATEPPGVAGPAKGSRASDASVEQGPDAKPGSKADQAPWAGGRTAAQPPGIPCPTCQTVNDPSRDFCLKCASPLRPAPVVKPRLITKDFVLRFLLGFVIGAGTLVGGAAVVVALRGSPAAPPITPVSLTTPAGRTLDLGLVAATNPKPIQALPLTATLQLSSVKDVPASAPPGEFVRAPWWDDTVPRIPAVSQFDGGPLQKVNCTMAAGAMLARLAFGIVTTGSQLRALQDDQDGGTSFQNLENALQRGWGVKFLRGSLTALQLRALSYAGAGVAVSLDYGEVPVGVRLQESFTGGHAVYIDAFRPAGPDGPAAYWVMDPIGHSWSGYKGGWWPAADVERSALTRGGGRVNATWAFAGGRIPDPRPVLPTDSYPGADPSAAPTPLPSGDPMPTGDLPVIDDAEIGTPPPEVPEWTKGQFQDGVFVFDPTKGFFRCVTRPTPLDCPTGIIGVTEISGLTPPLVVSGIELLYADSIAPGTYQVIFEPPPDTESRLWLWTGAGGALEEARVDSALLGDRQVSIATISLDPDIGFNFFATASGDGISAMTSIGSMVVSP